MGWVGVEVGFWHLSFRHPCDRKVIVWNIHIAGLTSSSLSPEKEHHRVTFILKEKVNHLFKNAARLLWNLTDISMLKELVRVRLSQTLQ